MKTKPDDPVVVTQQNANNPLYGLTKREYFAAMAMQGMLSNTGINTESHVAHYAVEFADALIERLNMDAEVKLPEDPWRLNEKK